MKNNLKFYLMSALCSIALINSSGYSMTHDDRAKTVNSITTFKNNSKPTAGLDNIGATCYMNSTLQALANAHNSSKEIIKRYDYNINSGKKDQQMPLTTVWVEVLKNLYDPNIKSYSPYNFKQVISQLSPLFKGIQANDSKDLLNFMLEDLHKELNIKKKNNNYIANNSNQLDEQLMLWLFLQEYAEKYNSPISDAYYGVMETKSQCLGCNNIKYNFQVYSFIEFPLEKINNYSINNTNLNCYFDHTKNMYYYNDKYTNIPCLNLYQCLVYYSVPELMQGDNQMYCNICNKSCNAYYGSALYKMPNENLIINLNRGRGATYECNVFIPETINFNQYTSYQDPDGNVYDLYCLICHRGESGMGGHFVCFYKAQDGKWYCYNDAIVSEYKSVEMQNLLQANKGNTPFMPYILFYTKRKTNSNSANIKTVSNNIQQNYQQNYQQPNYQQNYQQLNYQQQQNYNNNYNNMQNYNNNYNMQNQNCNNINYNNSNQNQNYININNNNISPKNNNKINDNKINDNKIEKKEEDKEINDLSKELDNMKISNNNNIKQVKNNNNIDNDNIILESNKVDYSDTSKITIDLSKDDIIQYVNKGQQLHADRKNKKTLTAPDRSKQFKALVGYDSRLKKLNNTIEMKDYMNRLLMDSIKFVVENNPQKNKKTCELFDRAWTAVKDKIQQTGGEMYNTLMNKADYIYNDILQVLCIK